jgi:hypothetical protein
MEEISDPRLRDMIENNEKYVAMMAKMPDKKLSRWIDTINIQRHLAWEQKNDRVLKRLDVMLQQVVEARLTKI